MVLNHFGHTWWRLGDRTIYEPGGGGGGGGGDAGGDNTDMQNCCEIVATQTTVDLKYIDGTSKEDVPATETLMFNPGMADGLRE